MGRLLTLGAIAESLNVAPERIAYIVRTRRIEPSFRAGTARVWKQADLPVIKAALDDIMSKRPAESQLDGVVPFSSRSGMGRDVN